MAKFYGVIGYAETKETSPGVWEEEIVERSYRGDVLRNTKSNQDGQNLNDNLVVNNIISIIANDFANGHLHMMRYVTWMGTSWEITKVDVQRPRLILTIGGVYNGK